MLSYIEATLFEKLKSQRALPSPSGVRLTIMRMCAEDSPDLADLTKLVQSDPALSGRIIRLVNIQNDGRLRPLGAVSKEALLIIGLQAIRQLALVLALSEAAPAPPCKNFDYLGFWSHAFAMAASALSISQVTRVAPLSEMFTAGLLASIGKLTLASARSAAYGALLEHQLEDSAQIAMEQSLFGFNHLTLAAALMHEWRMPELFCDAVLNHFSPQSSGFPRGSRQQEVVWTLHLALLIADRGCGGPSHNEAIDVARDFLNISRRDYEEIYANAGREWEEWRACLQFQPSTVLWSTQENGAQCVNVRP